MVVSGASKNGGPKCGANGRGDCRINFSTLIKTISSLNTPQQLCTLSTSNNVVRTIEVSNNVKRKKVKHIEEQV